MLAQTVDFDSESPLLINLNFMHLPNPVSESTVQASGGCQPPDEAASYWIISNNVSPVSTFVGRAVSFHKINKMQRLRKLGIVRNRYSRYNRNVVFRT